MHFHRFRQYYYRCQFLSLAYNNIKKRKDCNWTGIPTTVERSINDVIPIDTALNESMLSPSMLEKKIVIDIDDTDENALTNAGKKTNENDETMLDGITGDEKTIGDMLSDKEETNINDENKNIDREKKDDKKKEITRKGEDSNKQTRRSERIRKQRVEVHPDDIGDNDDGNDKSYK